MNNKVFIFGYGDVGKAIARCVAEGGYETRVDDPDKGYIIKESEESPIAVHICFPYTKCFAAQVSIILDVFKPKLTIIESTVPPEVFDGLFELPYPIVHSPVRGSHPNLFEDLHHMTKFVSNEHPRLCNRYYFKWKIPFNIKGTAQELAAGKIFSVNWFGGEICFSQMIKRYCEEKGYDFDNVYTLFQSTMLIGEKYEWNEKKGKAISHNMIPRPTMIPRKIKGHCVMQDIGLALENGIGNPNLWKWMIEENDATI